MRFAPSWQAVSIGPAELAALKLRGRRFFARESRTLARGIVAAVRFEQGFFILRVCDVEVREEDGWQRAEPIGYSCHEDFSTIWTEPDERVTMLFQAVAEIVILPENERTP